MDRIVAMKEGRVAMNGTASEVFSQYEAIREAGLDLPEACRLAELLTERGYPVPREKIRMKDVLDSAASALRGGAK